MGPYIVYTELFLKLFFFIENLWTEKGKTLFKWLDKKIYKKIPGCIFKAVAH